MTTKYLLPEDKIPTAWYNLAADLSEPAPRPCTLGPINRPVPMT